MLVHSLCLTNYFTNQSKASTFILFHHIQITPKRGREVHDLNLHNRSNPSPRQRKGSLKSDFCLSLHEPKLNSTSELQYSVFKNFKFCLHWLPVTIKGKIFGNSVSSYMSHDNSHHTLDKPGIELIDVKGP